MLYKIHLKKLFLGIIAVTSLVIGSCQINDVECNAECESGWMDSGNFRDSCLTDPSRHCLVSSRFNNPKDSLTRDTMLNTPVIIAVHGFTASTYEWQEFKKKVDSGSGRSNILVSLVLLGGHGRSIDTFQSSKWQDWGAPILQEYDSLVKKGYTNISFAGSSTGAALIMEYFADGQFKNRRAPNYFFLIDPIVIPTAKLLTLARMVGPILGNSPDEKNTTESRHWYTNRPEEELNQLNYLINGVKNHLEDGFNLPRGTKAKVFKSKYDNSADPVSALYIYNGMRLSDDGRVDVEMVDSRLHVFTRLQGRDPSSSADSISREALQDRVFAEMADKVHH